MDSETFIKRLERLMADRGLQQKDLAKKAGISSNGISTWKITGALPRADVAVKIADILGVTVEYLVTGHISNIDKTDELAYTVSKLCAKKRSIVQAVVDSLDVF
ncbi:helix-turn-helix domain-containing protein [Treponema sp.]|uniref:helix-turn-helix domain-containing protein n=1 Tax=Treponema sp. TaxID=166 RepID=UPI003FA2F1F8